MDLNFDTERAEEMYANGKSTYKIAEELEPCRSKIRRYIRDYADVDLRGSANYNQKVNSKTFFQPTNEARYWIGFLMADGNVYDNTITINLQKRDRCHLEKFRKFIGTENELRKIETAERKQNQFGLTFTSRRIANDLKRHGVIPNKSSGTKVKKLEEDPNFWRGMIDGDGWISRPNKPPRITLYGIVPILEQYKKYCQDKVGTNASIIEKTHAYSFKLTGQMARDMIQHLYCNQNIALKRKELKGISHLISHDVYTGKFDVEEYRG